MYTPEFKAKVVIEVIQGAKSLNDIAAQYNLNPNMVRTWKAEFLQKASSVFENPQKTEKEARRKKEALEKETNRMLKKSESLPWSATFFRIAFAKQGSPSPTLIQTYNKLSVRKQCNLLGINRSSIYYDPKKPTEEEQLLKEEIMARIDYWHNEIPAMGSRKMA